MKFYHIAPWCYSPCRTSFFKTVFYSLQSSASLLHLHTPIFLKSSSRLFTHLIMFSSPFLTSIFPIQSLTRPTTLFYSLDMTTPFHPPIFIFVTRSSWLLIHLLLLLAQIFSSTPFSPKSLISSHFP